MKFELFILLPPDAYLWIAAALLALLSLFAWKLRRGKLRLTALAAVLLGWIALLYGTFIGFYQFEVRHVELSFRDLPPAFDGYRIVQFSDAHVGTPTGHRYKILQRAVDSINAQKADLIVFTGDLQNKVPQEILPDTALLAKLKARDGVYSVLGNHDYAAYSNVDEFTKGANCGLTRTLQIEMGWHLLCNTHQKIRRDSQSIVIAGMENDGEGRFPEFGDISRCLYGLSRNTFVVTLEHDPSSWRRKIIPHSHAQLTLSGHTHGGQFQIFGWSPASYRFGEFCGLYRRGERALYVTKGLGGVVPFRLGAPGEIVVITLKRAVP